MTTAQSLLKNPSSIKTRFALQFIKALKKLNDSNRSSTPSMADRYKRYRLIRAASYASMASSVGPRRAWARAILRKIRNRTVNHSNSLTKKRITHHHSNSITRRRGFVSGNPREELISEQDKNLRELVPGGEGMDFCRLLNETGHYIKCLRAQVQVMRNILDHCSN